jgi:hypothetical protein
MRTAFSERVNVASWPRAAVFRNDPESNGMDAPTRDGIDVPKWNR